MTDTSPREPRPSPRTLRIVLVASLMLNLLLVGLFVGLLASGRGPGGGPRDVALTLGPLTEALAPEDRAAVRDRLRGEPRIRDLGRHFRETAMAELAAAIRTEPFDRAAVQGVLEAQTARIATVQVAARAAFLDRLEAMGAAGREAYAGRLEAHSGRPDESRD